MRALVAVVVAVAVAEAVSPATSTTTTTGTTTTFHYDCREHQNATSCIEDGPECGWGGEHGGQCFPCDVTSLGQDYYTDDFATSYYCVNVLGCSLVQSTTTGEDACGVNDACRGKSTDTSECLDDARCGVVNVSAVFTTPDLTDVCMQCDHINTVTCALMGYTEGCQVVNNACTSTRTTAAATATDDTLGGWAIATITLACVLGIALIALGVQRWGQAGPGGHNRLMNAL